MDKTLRIEAIKQAMDKAGLNQAALSAKLSVSKEIVSKWLSGVKFPRPDKLLRLSSALELNYDELVEIISQVNEPIIAFRKKGSTKTTEKHINRAKNIGRLLSCLVSYLPFDEFVQPSKLKNPKLEYEYVQSFTFKVRKEIGLRIDQVIDFTDLIHTFHELQAVIVPVMWGKKNVHENALHIYLPDSMTTWVYLNLDTELHDFKFWMAHELGHVFSPDLRGNEAEDFADAFAGALLFPQELAKQAYKSISSSKSDKIRISKIRDYALEYSISLISVYKEINNYAIYNSLPKIDLGNSLFGANTNFNKMFATVSGSLFENESPNAEDYIQRTSDVFETPFFDTLKKYLVEHGKSASYVQSILDTPLIDAKELYAELT